MKDQWKTILFYIAVLSLVTIAIYVISTHEIDLPATVSKPEPSVIHNITISISSDQWALTHTFETTKNSNVYALLNKTAQLYNFTIKKTYFKGYDSFFIQSINNINNGLNDKYWQFTVNNVYADRGCSDYFLGDNDTVQWFFQKSPF